MLLKFLMSYPHIFFPWPERLAYCLLRDGFETFLMTSVGFSFNYADKIIYIMREYDAFAYPPDYELANIHHTATRPGKVNPETSVMCPCCKESTKEPMKFWFKREINHDFKQYGGAVVTYFWLVKLYAFISFLVLALYSLFLFYTINRACTEASKVE